MTATDASGGGGGPHDDQPLVTAGTPLDEAGAALVLVHGRGPTAEGIVRLAGEFHREGVALVAPRAADGSWYPESFLEPVDRNEPGRTSALRAVGRAADEATGAGLDLERVMLLGFSQGACVATEFVARASRRYGGLAALSGGMTGETLDDDYPGDLGGTPVSLGCSDEDPYIPVERVRATADAFEALGADVTLRLYDGGGHAMNGDEADHVAGMVERLVG